MNFLELVVLGVGALVTIYHIYSMRRQVLSGVGISQQTVNVIMLWTITLICIPYTDISPLHLLLIFPASVVIGIFSLCFPVSLINLPGMFFGKLCIIGLNQREININSQKYKRFQELKMFSHLTDREAAQKVVEEFEGRD